MMKKSKFKIHKMDCPSEEQIIRMKLQNFTSIEALDFDIPNRELLVFHHENEEEIFKQLETLNFDTQHISTEFTQEKLQEHKNQTQLLWSVLGINFFFFLLEIFYGFWSNSMGLVADSLDMLADSFVYLLALFAVGKAIERKKNVAKISGYFQLILAILGLTEVLRRFFVKTEAPEFQMMMLISFLALLGNAACLYLLQKSKSKEAHIQASVIFTNNDVMINLGVIIAGVFVYFTHSKMPDLAIGTLIFILVTRGAFSILKLSK